MRSSHCSRGSSLLGLVLIRDLINSPGTFTTVVVRFKAVGNAPIMKQNLYKITASNRFQAVIQFLRKELGWKQGDPLVRAVMSQPPPVV